MKKHILLTGASGSVGYEILQQLISKKQYHITVFDIKSKNSQKKLKKFNNKCNIIYGDISSKSDVDKITKNQDVVLHLAAIIPPLADDSPPLAEKVNVQGTKNLIESLQKNSPQAFFVYSSSVSVYGDRVKNPNIKVGDPLIPSEGDEYAVTKITSENILRNSRLNWTIFRLSAIMGNHKISKLMFHMPLETSMEICTPKDTARAFVNSIEQQAILSNKIFNLGGGISCRLTYRELLSQSFKIFGLGALNFPEKAFAEKNFHCGNYIDGDDLEAILHFRRETKEDYFNKVASELNPIIKIFTICFRCIIKKILLLKSEPYRAYHQKNTVMIKRFFH